ncbi:hypothetical protein [Pinibacter aurantiacus]|uniref:Uncharacterized protein n=1 Tax=Pinibacter aurantiacus TaxID=2851599 RepID=A0A9E2SEB6_9BACT|nr:hypothetical protein [Pinibacter aurantiacus]MBV4359030.1 hypothetical protein [Pinibacter aurantiacus]
MFGKTGKDSRLIIACFNENVKINLSLFIQEGCTDCILLDLYKLFLGFRQLAFSPTAIQQIYCLEQEQSQDYSNIKRENCRFIRARKAIFSSV